MIIDQTFQLLEMQSGVCRCFLVIPESAISLTLRISETCCVIALSLSLFGDRVVQLNLKISKIQTKLLIWS